MTKINKILIVNLLLLPVSFLAVFSGSLLQVKYHAGRLPKTTYVLFNNYFDWVTIHKASASLFFIFLCTHIYLHKDWYYRMYKKNLLKRNAPIRLTIVLLVTAITGFFPWIQSLFVYFKGLETHFGEKFFIEIHDKLGILLIILLIFHITKRFRWIKFRLSKLFGKPKLT